MNKKVNVLVVVMGDWEENGIVLEKWDGWNSWFGMKKMVDDFVVMYEESKKFGGDVVDKIDWKEVMNNFVVNECDYFIDIENSGLSEFGIICFNVENMKNLVVMWLIKLIGRR